MKTLAKQIQDLSHYLGEEDGNAEAVELVINGLEKTLDNVSNIEFESNDELRDYVLGESDPLTDDIDGVSDIFREEVREVQHSIILHYSV